MSNPLRVLLIAIGPHALHGGFGSSPFGPFDMLAVGDGPAALAAERGRPFDAVLIDADRAVEASAALRAMNQSAIVVVSENADVGSIVSWLQQGAQDVLGAADLKAAHCARRVRAAIERKRVEIESRKAYSTDLATGLPHRQQLVEHMSQLLALREREPAPMAVLVLRIEGFSTTESRLGPQSADALRRKIAVRLRAAVRASDVVAAIDDESYVVLLGSLLEAADAERVGQKLAQTLMEPFSVGGVGIGVAVAVGIGQFPADGSQPDMLLRKAIGMALDETAHGRLGMANFLETGSRPLNAANDE